jgi:drug/metabolite transporter (DMT)-like permease
MTNSALTAQTRSRFDPFEWGCGLLLIGAVVALVLTTYRYFTPLSGITGTSGALLAMFGAASLIAGAIALMALRRGGLRVVFLVLSWLGVLLTLLAAALLHGWGASLALIVSLAGVGMVTVSTYRRNGDAA